MHDKIRQFDEECKTRIESYQGDTKLIEAAQKFMTCSAKSKYSYNFRWMGMPIIQYPQDMIAMQEIIWRVRPDLIVETGIAHGGSLVFYASLLELIESDGGTPGEIVGIDIDIRKHNRKRIQEHPMAKRIKMIQGSSTDCDIAKVVKEIAKDKERVIVCLDSNHEHEHVLEELKLYAGMTTIESYCVVFDTIIEEMPEDTYLDRPWGPGNNPMTAVKEFLKINSNYVIDIEIEQKLQITVSPSGYLKRIK